MSGTCAWDLCTSSAAGGRGVHAGAISLPGGWCWFQTIHLAASSFSGARPSTISRVEKLAEELHAGGTWAILPLMVEETFHARAGGPPCRRGTEPSVLRLTLIVWSLDSSAKHAADGRCQREGR